MVFELTSNCKNRHPSSSSSCAEYINEATCGFNHCRQCCINSAINDHTYAVLKKICRKIIKGFDRQQCREKYTVFDGGNSVNVRIHRSSFNNAPDLNDVGARGRQKQSGRQGNEENRNEYGAAKGKQRNSGRQGKEENGNEYGTSKGKRAGGTSDKSPRRGGNTDDDESKYGDQSRGSKSGKTKSGRADDDELTSRSKKSKTGGKSEKGEDDSMSKLSKEKRKSTNGHESALDKNKKGRGSRGVNDDHYNDNYGDKRNKPEGSDLNRKTRIQSYDSNGKTKRDGYDSNRKIDPSDVPLITNLRLKVRNGEKVGLDGTESNNRMGSYVDESSKSRRKRKSQHGNGKRRKSENSRVGGKSQSNIQGGRSVRASASKLTRSDEARPCDYLRANMEQRDISRQCFRNVCMPRNICSELIRPCFQQPLSCLCADICTSSVC